MYGYIYLTTNLATGKVYVGQHKCSEFDANYYGSGVIISKEIAEYGKRNFEVKIIDTAESLKELCEKEKHWITYYKSLFKDDCYNLANTSDSPKVIYITDEDKKVIDMHYNNLQEYKPRMSEEVKQEMEEKRRIKEHKKELYETDDIYRDFVDRMTTINRERCNTPEFKARISESTSNRYKDLDERKRHSQKLREVWSDPELRKEHSRILKEYYANKDRNCSFNYQKCALELNGEYKEFEAVKFLFEYLTKELNYTPDRRMQKRLFEEGAKGIGHSFLQKRFRHLNGLMVYKLADRKEYLKSQSQCQEEQEVCEEEDTHTL